MKAGIITIGDELLIGQVIDTNSAWISDRLDESGIRVLRRLTVGDDCREIVRAFDIMLELCELVVVTGGLGPTKDDITKATLADYFGCPLVEDQSTVKHLEHFLGSRGIDFNALNHSQAFVPQCCTVLRNDNGTAPGMWFERDGKVLVSLPGVPFEMKELMESEVLPRIKNYFGISDIAHRTVSVFGLPESELAAAIAKWEEALPPYLKLAYLPNPSSVRLRLSAYETGNPGVRDEIDRLFEQLREIIPSHLLPNGDKTLQESVGRILVGRSMTLAVAESCTGGALAASFTAHPGASAYFRGGVVAYSNEVKMSILGVKQETLERHGAVSEQTATEMVLGVIRELGSDFGIATTGIAGPDGATDGKPAGTVWIAVAGPSGVIVRKRSFGNLRQQNIVRATSAAVDMLRISLLDGGRK